MRSDTRPGAGGSSVAEAELAHTRLGEWPASAAAGDRAPYFQVVVERHGGARGRLPAASSPRPAPPARLVRCECGADGGAEAEPRRRGDDSPSRGPDRIEVYYLERGAGAGEFLATGGGVRETACERAVRGPARLLSAALAEALAGAALVVRVPLGVALAALRCALRVSRDALAGAAHATSDYALKPALAVTFNALVHPLLVFVGGVARGAHAALAPLARLLLELAEPPARLLAAVRLVEVHVHAPEARAAPLAAAVRPE